MGRRNDSSGAFRYDGYGIRTGADQRVTRSSYKDGGPENASNVLSLGGQRLARLIAAV